jgi:ubiquinone/menaquinone biosynthesis C-methylase UbiE
LDIDPDAEPDIVASITDMSMVESESVDGLFSSHNLEHIYSHEVRVALAEFHRVLRTDGIVVIRVPDLQAVAAEVARGNLENVLYQAPAGPIAPIDVLYGWRQKTAAGQDAWAHKTGFVGETLAQKLAAAGFRQVRVGRGNFQLSATAIK